MSLSVLDDVEGLSWLPRSVRRAQTSSTSCSWSRQMVVLTNGHLFVLWLLCADTNYFRCYCCEWGCTGGGTFSERPTSRTKTSPTQILVGPVFGSHLEIRPFLGCCPQSTDSEVCGHARHVFQFHHAISQLCPKIGPLIFSAPTKPASDRPSSYGHLKLRGQDGKIGSIIP